MTDFISQTTQAHSKCHWHNSTSWLASKQDSSTVYHQKNQLLMKLSSIFKHYSTHLHYTVLNKQKNLSSWLPVDFWNSSKISSRVLFFGMLPTNSRTLATDAFTLRNLPGLISKLCNCMDKLHQQNKQCKHAANTTEFHQIWATANQQCIPKQHFQLHMPHTRCLQLETCTEFLSFKQMGKWELKRSKMLMRLRNIQ